MLLANATWPGAKVMVKLADWPAAMVVGTLEVSMLKALGALVFTDCREMDGVVAETPVGLVRVNVMLLVELTEVFGKLRGEALEGWSVVAPVLD